MRRVPKHRVIASKLGIPDYIPWLVGMYANNMSGREIADYIKQNTGEIITPRSIQRVIARHSKTRDIKEAYNLAISKGRVKWHYKEFKYIRHKLNPKLHYTILKRDKFKCVKCGNTAENVLLEVDHIIPICKGGQSIESNLQTLCYQCNKGKQITEKEL
jgi:hypothetical protein